MCITILNFAMQTRSRFFCSQVGQAVTQLLSPRGKRYIQHSVKLLEEHEGLTDGGDGLPGSSGASTPTHLHSVLSVNQGVNTFAVATVTFGASSSSFEGAGSSGGAALSQAAQHAAQVALLALRGALGAQRPPSAVVALPALELPLRATQALAEALASQLGPDTALIGCSSRLRLPDELRSLAAAAGATHTATAPRVTPTESTDTIGQAASAASDRGLEGQDSGAPAPTSSSSSHPFHITLAGAHLPHHEAHAVHCATSSLPQLPYLAEALQGRRPPNFLLLSGSDSLAMELLGRLENLFPGSVIGAGVAAQELGRNRRLMLVGPSGTKGGGFGAPDARGGSRDMASEPPSSRVGAADHDSAAPRPPPAATVGAVPGRANTDRGTDDIMPSSSSTSSSKFEGHFSRMLLDRGGAFTSSSSSTISSSSSKSAGDGPVPGGVAGGGRRRRVPPASAATAPNRRNGSSSEHSSPGDADEAATAGPEASDHAEGLQPTLIMLGKELLIDDGGALLAIYPKDRSAAAVAAASAAARQQPPPHSPLVATTMRELGLGAASCDILARLALGSAHLLHVVLWGSALDAISTQPTGPEPAVPRRTASENPFYWSPARVLVPGLKVLASELHADAIRDLERLQPVAMQAEEQQDVSRNERDWGAGGGAAAVSSADANLSDDDDNEEEDGESGLAAWKTALLAYLSGGLRWLPLFPLEGVILFPGQTIQLRIFEKRYRLLARASLQQGTAFGLCWRGMGTTAVVRSYHTTGDGAGDLLVLLEGGVRFTYDTDALTVLPASYGLNAAVTAGYVVDEPPGSKEDAAALLAAAHTVVDSIAGALEEATAPSAQHTARAFANALHFASSSSNGSASSSNGNYSRSSSSSSSPSPSSSTSEGPPFPPNPQPSLWQQQQQQQQQSSSSMETAGGSAALLAEDIAEAKRSIDMDTASLLSLYLAPHIPVHLDSLRREWYTSRSALWRLQQEAAWLRSSPRVAMAVAASVLRLPQDNPLRIMLGLSRVSPVNG